MHSRGSRKVVTALSIYHLIWFFFCYSFLGWALETALAAVKQHRYVDRSLLFGPWCVIYGVTGVAISLGLRDLAGNWFFLLLGSALLATVIEWVAGHWLERVSHTRWWDYSKRRWNLDGYICLSASLLWGLMGMAVVLWVNPLLGGLFDLIPALISHPAMWVLVALLAIDCLGTAFTLAGTVHKLPSLEAVNNRLAALSVRMGQWILRRTEGRIQKAYPGAQFVRTIPREKPTVFAQGCSFYKIFLLFIIGAFLGDIVETLFCRATMGVWMSRSSVVWGPFSIVWGLAMALATLLLYQYKDRSASFLFWAGTLVGGVYEYLCSVFTEVVFGTVFWDYSSIPFNLGGRINLLYCFFWGFAAVAWFRLVYPHFSAWIEKIPMGPGKIITWCLVVFMACNITVSTMALSRYDSRSKGLPATTAWEQCMDDHYGDARMAQIYPCAVRTDS